MGAPLSFLLQTFINYSTPAIGYQRVYYTKPYNIAHWGMRSSISCLAKWWKTVSSTLHSFSEEHRVVVDHCHETSQTTISSSLYEILSPAPLEAPSHSTDAPSKAPSEPPTNYPTMQPAREFRLVLRYEFNTPGRQTFQDGTDPRWTALYKNDYTTTMRFAITVHSTPKPTGKVNWSLPAKLKTRTLSDLMTLT